VVVVTAASSNHAGPLGYMLESLRRLNARVECYDLGRGLWVRASSGTMRQWTHPAMVGRLDADPAHYAHFRNADTTLIGFAVSSAPAEARARLQRDVVAPWKASALDRDCIAPAGSSCQNHRQDQAVLSFLVHEGGYAFADEPRASLGVRCKCDRWFYQYIGFHVPAAVYAWCCLY
jgi:hypothetical protein